MGDYESLTTSAAGLAGGTTLVDASLANLVGGADDDFCINQYVAITSGAADTEIRKISGYASATNTITVNEAFSVQIANGVTYELHRYDPKTKRVAINRAIEQLWPILYLPVRDDWSIIVDDLLTDSSYEKALSGGAFPDWTNSGAGIAVAAETSRVFQAAQSAKITSGAGAAGQIYQEPTVNVHEVIGKTVSFRRWVWASVASVARVRIDWDGTNFANSDYHTADDEWQRLEAQANVPATATRVRAICEVASGSEVAYFDAGGNAGLFIDKIYRYTLPTTLVGAPSHVLMQANLNEPNGAYNPLQRLNLPRRGRHLRILGRGMLTRPATDGATVEVGEPQVRLIVYKALEIFWQMVGSPAGAAMAERQSLLLSSQDAERKFQNLLTQRRGLGTQRLGAMERDGTWHTEENSTSRFLVLDSHE